MTTETTALATLSVLWKQGKSPLLDSWTLYSDPLAVALILVVYLAFVLYLGPKFMKKREPFNLKIVLILYNAVKVFYNFSILEINNKNMTFIQQYV
ncbi:hypothetical protein HA402_008619 [Bradysia odoriphaga]|nr:hypothetical protein HA402_008619 [Bradysia odoriphaga]